MNLLDGHAKKGLHAVTDVLFRSKLEAFVLEFGNGFVDSITVRTKEEDVVNVRQHGDSISVVDSFFNFSLFEPNAI